MRQITDELKTSPFDVARVRPIEEAVHPSQQAMHAAWVHNKQVEMAHKYCVKRTGVDFKKADFDDAELGSLKACLQKYQSAFKIYQSEA